MTDGEVIEKKQELWALFHKLWSSTGTGRGKCFFCKRSYVKDDWQQLQTLLTELLGLR